MSKLLHIKDITICVSKELIVKNISLDIACGETHAIMGPNGSGKSSLAYALAGHPKYKVTHGIVNFCGENLCGLSPDKRAKLGMFLGFQYRQE